MAGDRITITPENRGPIVNIISWILIVLTSLATLTKIWSKWSLTKKLGADDWYLSGSTLTAAGWVGAAAVQVKAGLGRHANTMSRDDFVRFQQSAYGSEFLYVISLCLAKMAILQFMLTLARAKNRRLAVYGTMVFNAISMLIGIFAVAFQCPVPETWATLSSKCFDQASFWIAFGVMDIIVDFATVVLPFFLLHDLRTTWKRKLPAIAAFGLRFLIIPMIVVRLVLIRFYAGTSDYPFDDFDIALATSVHVNFSVIFTCLPFLKTVMDNIQTGLLGGEVHVRDPSQVYGYGYGYKLGRRGNSTAQQSTVTSMNRNYSVGYTPPQKSRSISYDEGSSQAGRDMSFDQSHQPLKRDWMDGFKEETTDRSKSYDTSHVPQQLEPIWNHRQPRNQRNKSYDHTFQNSATARGYGGPDRPGYRPIPDDRMVINQTTTFSVRDDRI